MTESEVYFERSVYRQDEEQMAELQDQEEGCQLGDCSDDFRQEKPRLCTMCLGKGMF